MPPGHARSFGFGNEGLRLKVWGMGVMVYKLGAGGWRVGPTCDAPRTCKERARYLILRAKRGALEKHMKKKRRPLEKQNKKKKEPSEKKNKAPKVSNMEALASERVARKQQR